MLTFVPAIRRFAVWADEALRALSEAILHPYRCDLYYMRGPGSMIRSPMPFGTRGH